MPWGLFALKIEVVWEIEKSDLGILSTYIRKSEGEWEIRAVGCSYEANCHPIHVDTVLWVSYFPDTDL